MKRGLLVLPHPKITAIIDYKRSSLQALSLVIIPLKQKVDNLISLSTFIELNFPEGSCVDDTLLSKCLHLMSVLHIS